MTTPVVFTCNICRSACKAELARLERESPTCRECESSVRYRAIIHSMSLALFGESIPLPDFPKKKSIRVLGMSDWGGFQKGLSKKFEYLNTRYDQEPRLDLKAVPRSMLGAWDIIVCSEVMEHVTPPVQPAFDALRELLRPGGTLIFTAPYRTGLETKEHFPELNEFALTELGGKRILVNRTVDGRYQVFDDLCFHGGAGSTLEMRIFGRSDLLNHLQAAGLEPRIAGGEYLRFGIAYESDFSLPIVAHKPK